MWQATLDKKENMEIEYAIISIKGGNLPKSLDDKVSMVKTIEKVVLLSANMISIVLATARIEDFNDDENKWARWVTEQFGYSKEYRCHLNLIGKMLVGMREKYPECLDRLFLLDYNKNLAIARLYRGNGAHDVQRFMAAHVEKMSREEVRDAVDLCMGIKPPEKDDKKKQPEPPKLEDQILHLNNKFARTEPQKIIEGFSPNTAILAINVGIGCMSAVSAYYKNTGGYRNLSVEQLNKMEAAAQKIFKQFGAWREELATTNLKDAS